MAQIGSFALLLALALSIVFVRSGPVRPLLSRRPELGAPGRNRPPRRHRSLRMPSSSPPSPSSSPPSATTSPSPTSSITATATSPAPTNSPRSGPARKARCSSGRSCSPATASSFACATRPTRASSPTPQSFSPACRSFSCCSSISPPTPSACSKARCAPTAAA